MFVGTIETSNYTLNAYGNTAEAVHDLLVEAWGKHAEATGAWLSYDEMDANIREVEAGYVYWE
jgi:single-stranded DNA-specific DHH superfamily exonuclease